MVVVKFLGHSAFQVDLGHRTVFFDPWLDPKPKEVERLVPPAVTEDKVRQADIILVSNESFDHCSPFDVNSIAQRTFAQVVAPKQTLDKLSVPPRSKVPVNAGDSFALMGVDISVVPARQVQSANPVGYIIRNAGKSLYFAGDTYDYYGMTNYDVDLAILPIGGGNTMDGISALKALKQMRARIVVPMHYDTYARIRVDVQDFAKRVANGTKTECCVMRPGEELEF